MNAECVNADRVPDDELINHPFVRTKAAIMAEAGAGDPSEGCALLRGAALLIATLSADSTDPEASLSTVLTEFAEDARMLLKTLQAVEAIQNGVVQ